MITLKYKWTIWLSLVSIPMMALAFVLMHKADSADAVGPAVVLFPSGYLSYLIFRAENILALVGLLQYPVYGIIIDRVITKHKNYLIIPVIMMIHMLMVSFVMGHMSNG